MTSDECRELSQDEKKRIIFENTGKKEMILRRKREKPPSPETEHENEPYDERRKTRRVESRVILNMTAGLECTEGESSTTSQVEGESNSTSLRGEESSITTHKGEESSSTSPQDKESSTTSPMGE